MKRFDAIVIGSGAGGAPVVEALCRSGARVLLIERGAAYTRDDFADRDEIAWARRDRFIPSVHESPHTRRFSVDAQAFPTTDGWISSILGGGTVHMSGFFLPFVEADARQKSRLDAQGELEHTAIDWAVPFAEVAAHYGPVAQEVGVSGVGFSQAPLVEHPIAKVVEQAARRLALPCRPTPRAVLQSPRSDEDRGACAYRLTCASYGCPNDARGSTAVTYLRRAQKTNNLTVMTRSEATELRASGGSVTEVNVVHRPDGKSEVVSAAVVVVACSAIESARLLLLSGINPGQVGKNLWFSVYTDVNGFCDAQRFADAMHHSPFVHRTIAFGGALSAREQRQWNLDRAGALDVLWQHDNPIHRAERTAFDGDQLLWGAPLREALKRQFQAGRTLLCEGFGESVPHAAAFVDLDPRVRDDLGRPVARITHAHHPRDGRVAEAMVASARSLLTEMGCQDVRTRVGLSETTILQGGTCRFADSPESGVTDVTGRVFGMKNVFVSDGGALPSSGTAPSTFTILANARRIAAHVVEAARRG